MLVSVGRVSHQAVILGLAGTIAAPGLGSAQSARDIAQRTFPSVVLLLMEDAQGQPNSLGSGFFVRPNVVATNLHVVRGTTRGTARIVGSSQRLSISGIVALDSVADLALLQVSGATAPALSLGDSRGLAVGDVVYAVGNPEGLEGTFSQGIVSGIRRIRSDTLLQITAPISPGSSGGPILDSSGAVVGVAVATFTEGQNLNFAVPSAALSLLLERVGPAQSLSSAPAARSPGTYQSELGPPATEGVVISHVSSEDYGPDRKVTFTIQNRLAVPVGGIDLLIILYDHDGNPIDSYRGPHCCVRDEYGLLSMECLTRSLGTPSTGPIPPGLARRSDQVVRGDAWRLNRRVEIRVLNYRVVR